MGIVFRAFPDQGVVALFDEPNTTGAMDDFFAARNAPARNPEAYMERVYFHSVCDPMEVLVATTASISHSSIAGISAPGGEATSSAIYAWAGAVDDKLLLDLTSYGLTEEPFALVALNDRILTPGIPIQTDTGGRVRYGTLYATTTALRIAETATKTTSSLGAVTNNYQIIVFKKPAGDINDVLMGFDPGDGVFQMGFGRFRTDRKYLQVTPGGSPLVLNRGRSIDLANGAPRFVLADGTAYEPVTSGATWVLAGGSSSTPATNLKYNGSFTNTDGVEVQAP